MNKAILNLNNTNAMLSKRTHSVDTKLNKSICHVIFQQHLPHAPLFWLQNSSSLKILIILQKKIR